MTSIQVQDIYKRPCTGDPLQVRRGCWWTDVGLFLGHGRGEDEATAAALRACYRVFAEEGGEKPSAIPSAPWGRITPFRARGRGEIDGEGAPGEDFVRAPQRVSGVVFIRVVCVVSLSRDCSSIELGQIAAR